ncbi:MAG: alpha/beta hydrolase [Thiotrichales bacterium]|nr:alpha/beta hydrolase [Thiotrichales bacterium]MAX28875.1 alpha/beta hydrolase [Thiotrichales bacterium]OUX54014.1 MAG: alpha/beta hydrolase [Methylococcaceae bacterium TMED282]
MSRHSEVPTTFWSDLNHASFEQGYLEAGSIRTRYLHSGERELPPLLLLHGTGGHAECYMRNLSSHGRYFDTWAIDFVGHGWSGKPDVDYEIDYYVEHVASVMDALGISKAHISGESLGGWVGARFALKYPERIMRLVLNTTGGATMNPSVMEKIKVLTRAAVNDPEWDTVRARLEWLMADPATVTDELVRCRREIYMQDGFKEALEHILVLQDPEIRLRNNLSDDEWSNILAETLVIWTSDDPTADDSVGRRIASLIPNAKYELMLNCGHWPQYEDPKVFNEIHLSFLRGCG